MRRDELGEPIDLAQVDMSIKRCGDSYGSHLERGLNRALHGKEGRGKGTKESASGRGPENRVDRETQEPVVGGLPCNAMLYRIQCRVWLLLQGCSNGPKQAFCVVIASAACPLPPVSCAEGSIAGLRLPQPRRRRRCRELVGMARSAASDGLQSVGPVSWT